MIFSLGAGWPSLTGAGEPPDTQLWNEAKLTARLNDRFDLVVGGVLRLGDDVSQIIRVSSLLGVNVKVTKIFSFTPNYQYIVDDPGEADQGIENRFGLWPTLSLPLASSKVVLSNGLEFRSFETKPDMWRWRPRLSISHPVGPKALGLSAYLSDEFFYEINNETWTRNRLSAGLGKRLGEHITVQLYYTRQMQLKANQQDLNIIGLSWLIDFGPTAKPVVIPPTPR
ncbi:MAG: DUF2490 domain-containing protein [Chthoniobacterales bacterium]